MTDEKMLELAEQAGVVRAKGDWCIFDESELRKFAALVRRDALLEARTACLKYTFASYAVDEIAALAAQEADK